MVYVNNKPPPSQTMELFCVITANFLYDDHELAETLWRKAKQLILYMYIYIYIYI
jgi:hypothetical protein